MKTGLKLIFSLIISSYIYLSVYSMGDYTSHFKEQKYLEEVDILKHQLQNVKNIKEYERLKEIMTENPFTRAEYDLHKNVNSFPSFLEILAKQHFLPKEKYKQKKIKSRSKDLLKQLKKQDRKKKSKKERLVKPKREDIDRIIDFPDFFSFSRYYRDYKGTTSSKPKLLSPLHNEEDEIIDMPSLKVNEDKDEASKTSILDDLEELIKEFEIPNFDN